MLVKKFVKIYLLSLSIFSLFRLVLFISEFGRIDNTTSTIDIFHAFLMGLRFDVVVTSYLLILPFFILTIASFFKFQYEKLLKPIFYLLFLLFSCTFIITGVDIPYFNQFFSRLTVIALEWMDTPMFVFSMAFSEPRYWFSAVPTVLCIAFFYKYLKEFLLNDTSIEQAVNLRNVLFSVGFLALIFGGIRGRISLKSPIRVGTAYFSNNAFLNQLGLNPNYTLLKSYLKSRKKENQYLKLMDNELAIANVQKYLDFTPANKEYPLMREVTFDSGDVEQQPNIVIVIMESMSAAKMSRHGHSDNLTPFLDSLSHEGYYFENTYTAGIHTFNGVYGTLCGMPALFEQHSMKGASLPRFHSIYRTLKDKGYTTGYFTTTDGQFDNTEGFLHANDCEHIITQDNYPPEEIKTTLGVPDDYMFRWSIPVLNEWHKKKQPFVTAMMTLSDHGPYYIPEYFHPKSTETRKMSVEYADYSLRVFMEKASKQPWFDNTIFVFVADHGAAMDGTYEMSLDYNHSPLLFYGPKIIKEPKIISSFAGQIDVFPTIMGFLKQPYINNTLGVDLFQHKRPYMYFNGDNKYGVIDENWFLIVREDKTKLLYKYKTKDKTNYAGDFPEIVREMETYGQSNMQACQYVLATGKQ
jgi:phosphoglycerol transferase MdoB-like AlkP superfamily enzyme